MANENVYCDIQMTIEEAVELLEVVRSLRENGRHLALDATFLDMQTQLIDSISYAASGKTGGSKPHLKN